MSEWPKCPECRDGKHGNCVGIALDEELDETVPCCCRCALEGMPWTPLEGQDNGNAK